MHFITALAVAAVAVSASPVERVAKTITMPLTKVNNIKSMRNVVSSGQSKLENVNSMRTTTTTKPQSKQAAAVSSGTITNEDVTYVAPVSIGGNTWQLIVDTGCMLFLILLSRSYADST